LGAENSFPIIQSIPLCGGLQIAFIPEVNYSYDKGTEEHIIQSSNWFKLKIPRLTFVKVFKREGTLFWPEG